MIAVIFAAAMSTLSGEFNSLATASHGRLLPALRAPDRRERGPRPAGLAAASPRSGACFACLVALQAGQLGSAIEVVNRFGSYFYGSILGVFALAVLAPRAAGRGAFYGLLVGMATVAAVARLTRASISSGTTWWGRSRCSWPGSASRRWKAGTARAEAPPERRARTGKAGRKEATRSDPSFGRPDGLMKGRG